MKVLIFPNDPLIAYLEKGELKDRYFNPNNIFDEVHFITFADKECKVKDIQKTIGDAKGYIYRFDKLSIFDMFFPSRRVNEIKNIINNLNFDIVRSYNPIYNGYYAGLIAKELKKPFLMSLHGNYDLDIRYQYLKNKDKRYLKYLLTKFTVEPKVLEMVTHVLGAYDFAAKYAIDNGVDKSKISIIYNRVYFNRFKPNKSFIEKKELKVICVGRLIQEKGQRTLIDAIPKLTKNISFTFVGDGEDYELLQLKVKEHNVENRVTFIKSIPNEKLAVLYREYDIFALPIQYGGICIPALEATASGLALVMPKPIHEDTPEITGEYGEIVENSPIGFVNGIQKVADDFALREYMVNKGLNIIKEYSGDIMEQKESVLYERLIHEE